MASFSQTRQEILKRALRICGTISAGQEPRPEDFQAASDCLNTLNEDLHNEGVFLWQKEEFDITTVVDQASYTIANTYETVESARLIKSADDEWPMKQISNPDYEKIRDKTYTGDAYRYMMGNELTDQTITFWPVPDAILTVRCVGVKLHPTLVNNGDTADFPPNWLNVLTFGTAFYYSFEAQLPESRVQLLQGKYEMFLNKAKKRRYEEVDAVIDNAYENTYDE